MLYIMVSIKGQAGGQASFQVTLGDGRALPDWLQPAGPGVLIGLPPAGLPSIDLGVHAAVDGSVRETIPHIDLVTGTIVDQAQSHSGMLEPRLFGDQMLAELERFTPRFEDAISGR